jgi:hypothetical protein
MNEIPDFFHQELSFGGMTPFPSLDLATDKVEMGRGCVNVEVGIWSSHCFLVASVEVRYAPSLPRDRIAFSQLDLAICEIFGGLPRDRKM